MDAKHGQQPEHQRRASLLLPPSLLLLLLLTRPRSLSELPISLSATSTGCHGRRNSSPIHGQPSPDPAPLASSASLETACSAAAENHAAAKSAKPRRPCDLLCLAPAAMETASQELESRNSINHLCSSSSSRSRGARAPRAPSPAPPVPLFFPAPLLSSRCAAARSSPLPRATPCSLHLSPSFSLLSLKSLLSLSNTGNHGAMEPFVYAMNAYRSFLMTGSRRPPPDPHGAIATDPLHPLCPLAASPGRRAIAVPSSYVAPCKSTPRAQEDDEHALTIQRTQPVSPAWAAARVGPSPQQRPAALPRPRGPHPATACSPSATQPTRPMLSVTFWIARIVFDYVLFDYASSTRSSSKRDSRQDDHYLGYHY